MVKIKQQPYDFVLMDCQMQFRNGAELTADLFRLQPDLKVLGLSYYDDPMYARRMHDAGTKGYV